MKNSVAAVWLGACVVCAGPIALPEDQPATAAAAAAEPAPAEDYAQQIHDLIEAAQPEGECNAWDGIAAFADWWEARQAENEAAEARGEEAPWGIYPCGVLWSCNDGNHTAEEIARSDRQTTRTFARLYKDGVMDATMESLQCHRSVPAKVEGNLGSRPLRVATPGRLWAYVGMAQAKMAFDAERPERGVACTASVLDCGRVLSGGMLIDRLVGIAVVQLAVDKLSEWLMAGELSPEALDGLAAVLDGRGRLGPMPLTIECEQRLYYSMIDDAISGLAAADGAPAGGPDGAERRAQLRRVVDRAIEHWARIHAAHQSERLAIHEAFDGEALLNEIDPKFEDLRAGIGMMVTNMRGMFPGSACMMMARSSDAHETQFGGLRLLVALDRYRNVRGHYPDQLEALVPGFLPELPRDMFAIDGKFRYLRVDPHGYGAHGGYLLYSVGADCTDEGGKIAVGANGARDNRSALWGKRQGACDFVVNLPEPAQ